LEFRLNQKKSDLFLALGEKQVALFLKNY